MPIPENMQVENPQMVKELLDTRVKFLKSYRYAYKGGVFVVSYAAGQIADVSEDCADRAISDGAAEGVDADSVELFDPKKAPPVVVKKSKK